jgi:hypothetical protein
MDQVQFGRVSAGVLEIGKKIVDYGKVRIPTSLVDFFLYEVSRISLADMFGSLPTALSNGENLNSIAPNIEEPQLTH